MSVGIAVAGAIVVLLFLGTYVLQAVMMLAALIWAALTGAAQLIALGILFIVDRPRAARIWKREIRR